jgi:hypothetical protein
MIDRLSVWGPMLIPLIPAGLSTIAIGKNYHDLLHFPQAMSWPIGLISGAGIEVFGIVANENYLDMQRYNQTLREGEERAPEEEARKARNTYMGIVIGLMSTLEVIPMLVSVTNAPQVIGTVSVLASLFPLVFLAVLAGQVIIMRKQHRARVDARHAQDQADEEAAQAADEITRLTGMITERDKVITALQQRVTETEQNAVHVTEQWRTEREQLNTELVTLRAQFDALRAMYTVQTPVLYTEQTEHQSDPDTVQAIETVTLDDGRNTANEQKRVQKANRQSELLQILFTELNGQPSDQLNKSALAERLNTTRVTIGRDIDELIAAQRLSVNGHINVL